MMARKDVFFRGETVIINASTFIGHKSSPADPDSIKISIYDHKNGPEIENADMVKDSVGHYHYEVDTSQITELGRCKIVIEVVRDGRTSIDTGQFILTNPVPPV